MSHLRTLLHRSNPSTLIDVFSAEFRDYKYAECFVVVFVNNIFLISKSEAECILFYEIRRKEKTDSNFYEEGARV